MSPSVIPVRRELAGCLYGKGSGPCVRTGRDWRDIIEREGLTLRRDPDGAIAAYKGHERRLEVYLEPA